MELRGEAPKLEAPKLRFFSMETLINRSQKSLNTPLHSSTLDERLK